MSQETSILEPSNSRIQQRSQCSHEKTDAPRQEDAGNNGVENEKQGQRVLYATGKVDQRSQGQKVQHDLDAGKKRQVAQDVLGQCMETGTGVLSTQVLQEFFVVSTRKLGVKPQVARRKVELLSQMEVLTIRLEHILGAVDLHCLHDISFWDALVVKCAASAGCA